MLSELLDDVDLAVLTIVAGNTGCRSAQVTRVLHNLARRYHLVSITSSSSLPALPSSAHVMSFFSVCPLLPIS